MIKDDILNLVNKYDYKTINEDDSKYILDNIASLLKENKIIIYGLGVSGQFYNDLLKNLNINISYFIDRNAEKITSINNIEIHNPNYLLEEKDNTILIIAGNPSTVSSILNDLEKLNLPQNINILEGDKLLSILKCSYCLKNVEEGKGIKFTDCSICYNEESYCSAFLRFFEKEKNVKIQTNDFTIPLVGYILGQICTLKCKHCCEAVPYIEKPIFTDKEQIIKDLKKIAESTDFISRIEFIGGEPFLHKDLTNIISEVLKIKNVGYVLVFTNATVEPSKELIEILKNPRVVVNFSGYRRSIPEKLFNKTKAVKELLEKEKVNFSFYNPEVRTWFDMNVYNKRDLSIEELEKCNEICFIHYCHRVFNGHFYCCPHYYSGVQLNKVQVFNDICIDLHSNDVNELRKKLINLKEMKYYEACKYCNLPYDAETVEPAIQL